MIFRMKMPEHSHYEVIPIHAFVYFSLRRKTLWPSRIPNTTKWYYHVVLKKAIRLFSIVESVSFFLSLELIVPEYQYQYK